MNEGSLFYEGTFFSQRQFSRGVIFAPGVTFTGVDFFLILIFLFLFLLSLLP